MKTADIRIIAISLKEKYSFQSSIEAKIICQLVDFWEMNHNIDFDFRGQRLMHGYTLRKLEKITGISNSYLSQLETGKIDNPSHEVVIKLRNLYADIDEA